MFSSTRHQFLGILSASSLLLLAAFPARATVSVAEISGIFHGGPGLDIVETSPGDFEPVGYVYPSLMYTLPGPLGGGGQASGVGMGLGTAQYVNGYNYGQRGLVMTDTGWYQLGTLGTSSVAGWTPAGFGTSTAIAVNSSGLIVGNSTLYSPDGTRELGGRAVYYEANSSVAHELALPSGYTDTTGYGIAGTAAVSSTGVIVGYANAFNGDTPLGIRAVRWNSKTSTAQVLDKLPGYSEYGDSTSWVSAVNNAGTAVGTGNTFNSSGQLLGYSAVRWDANTTHATALGNLGTSADDGTFSSSAAAINKAGTTVGQSSKYSSEGAYEGERAVRWAANSTAPVELRALASDATGASFSAAIAINDAGTTIGVSQQYGDGGIDLGLRAVSWAAGSTTPTELALLSVGSNGESFSYAFSINAAGYIAGTANIYGTVENSLYDADSHAVVWTPTGQVIDLNTLMPADSEWTLESAYSISDTGWVTGMALYQPEGQSSDYLYSRLFSMQLMMPVPEPTSTAMLALGLAALALLRRRRQR